MSEKRLRRQVVDLLKPICAFAVENMVLDGTPDVVCTAGWLELKIATLPKRVDTSRVVVDLRPAQRIWLRRWRQHGGKCWTFTRIDMDEDPDLYLLHDGAWSAECLGESTLAEMMKNAIASYETFPTATQLIGALIQKMPMVK